MREIAAVLLGLASLPAPAQGAPRLGRAGDTSSAVALRGGYGLPFGEVIKGLDLEDFYAGTAPGWIELGARGRHAFLGAYFQYASAFVKDCPPGMSCSGYSMRAGVEVLYSFVADARFSPWAGVGIGWEGAKLKKGPEEARLSAFEFANLQLGGDLRMTRALAIGPYASVSFARFLQADGEKLEDTAMHGWLQMGLRCELRF